MSEPLMSPGLGPRGRQLPIAAIAADWIAVALLVVGGLVFKLGPYRFHLLEIVVRVGSPWRAWLLALVVWIVRFLLVPHFPVFFRKPPTLVDEEELFESRHIGGLGRFWRLGALAVGFLVLVVLFTWPQALHMNGVPDLGDPLFSIWRIGWVNHQLWRDPLALFDANIFYPERLTLAYSDAIIVPALMAAPLLAIGIPSVVAYNLLFLSAFVLSGMTMFTLVRAVTGSRQAAVVAGVIFTLYPFRFEHYSHLELQMTMWMPLALWGLHLAMTTGGVRAGLLTGITYALQMFSSMYFGLYFAPYLVVVGLVLWVGRRSPARQLLALSLGALLASVSIAPLAGRYLANESLIGARDPSTVQSYSAEWSDYLQPHARRMIYRRWAPGGHPERQLFPGITPVILTGVALWPPLSITRVAYAAALAVTVEGSLGLNGRTFPWLRGHVPGYSGLRVPARFSLLAGMTMAILSGFAIRRLARRWPARSWAITGVVCGAVLIEAWPNLELHSVWKQAPGVYSALPHSSNVVLAEFPMASNLPTWFPDTRYQYFSTFHWHKMVNGDSGFYPPSYDELIDRMRSFPFADSLQYLHQRGVTHITLNGAFVNATRYERTAEELDARHDLELVAVSPWEGSEVRLYRFRE